MTLAPKLPPGRANRKALQFAADIHRLRHAGYTFSAIRKALLDAGISVGLSTVKREAARVGVVAMPTQQLGVMQRPPSATASMATWRDVTAPPLAAPSGATGREIAEAFFTANPSNPLLQAKETS